MAQPRLRLKGEDWSVHIYDFVIFLLAQSWSRERERRRKNKGKEMTGSRNKSRILDILSAIKPPFLEQDITFHPLIFITCSSQKQRKNFRFERKGEERTITMPFVRWNYYLPVTWHDVKSCFVWASDSLCSCSYTFLPSLLKNMHLTYASVLFPLTLSSKVFGATI